MGANAQTSVPTFTAGEVLTAANMNIIARTGIPVFADSTARDAAFGGTGEKTLAEGQYAYLESTNQTLVYDGAAWQAVGASGLTLISATTIGTTVASVTVTGAFSATYDNYRITISGGVGSTNDSLNMILGATATGYYRAGYNSTYASASLGASQGSNATVWRIGYLTTNIISCEVELFNPNLAKRSLYAARFVDADTTGSGFQVGGVLTNNTQYTDFTITPTSGTLTGGTIRVYGYANS